MNILVYTPSLADDFCSHCYIPDYSYAIYIQGILDLICSLIPFQTGDSPDSPTLFVIFRHTDADATLPCVFHNITTTDLLFIKW